MVKNYGIFQLELSIRIILKSYSNNFKDIYDQYIKLIYQNKSYGSLLMLVNLMINPDIAITQERLYQDYTQEWSPI
jgi:hypothetical protein